MRPLELSGTLTALVTPMAEDGSIDFEALDRLVDAQIDGGVTGLVPCGTTGETPTLTGEEQLAVIQRVVARAAGKVPVVAGTGVNDTRASIEKSLAAVEAGADGVMIVMPYYNKPSQAGMKAHVLAIAEAVKAPIVLYNIPGRSVVELAPDTTEAICEAAPHVVALKDATGNVLQCQELARRLGDRLTLLSGDDGLTLGMMALGAKGVISVSANVLPAAVSAVTQKMAAGDLAAARALHLELLPFHAAMFLEPNPAPAKAALQMLGAMTDRVRLPLVPASEAVRSRLEALLRARGAV